VRYEEGRNGGLPQGNSKFIILKQTAVSAFLPMNQNNMSSRIHSSGMVLNNWQILSEWMRDLWLSAGTFHPSALSH